MLSEIYKTFLYIFWFLSTKNFKSLVEINRKTYSNWVACTYDRKKNGGHIYWERKPNMSWSLFLSNCLNSFSGWKETTRCKDRKIGRSASLSGKTLLQVIYNKIGTFLLKLKWQFSPKHDLRPILTCRIRKSATQKSSAPATKRNLLFWWSQLAPAPATLY